ncbi:MAG: alpha/beta hydrolase [Bacteroidota bacterium]
MPTQEKRVSYTASNSYSSLNNNTDKTENIWIACHGLGYLSRYFIRYFNHLDATKNYVICPQAPSKYYQGNDFKYVGASWLTKEKTIAETENILRYLDAVFANEDFKNKRLILFGYSQGVSVAMRWMASRKIVCNDLVIHSGSIPKELNPKDFEFHQNLKTHLIYGIKDEYLTSEKLEYQLEKANALFPNNLNIIPFEGKHVVNRTIIQQIAAENS